MKKEFVIASLWFIPFLTGCQGDVEKPKANEPVKVKAVVVKDDAYVNLMRYSGTVEEENGTSLSFAVAGTIKTMNVRLGQHVSAGQLIATLDPTSMQNSHKVAHAALEQAEDASRRMKELHDKGSLPDMNWVEVQSKLEQARSMEQIARRNLDDCRLRAPFSGIIAEKSMEAGENVAPGMPVARLVTASSLVVRISVPEAEMRSVRTGQKADVAVTAIGGEKIAARVVEKGVVANPLSRTYEVRLKLENTDKEVLPGMVTEVFLHPYKTASGIHYVIPAHVVQIDEHNRFFVWCVKDGKARRRFIVCDEYSVGGVIVTSGLSANDSIIVEGQQNVCEGTEVAL